ncbi:Uncharacterised protein [Bacteroides xylanisolvens]|nr:Uncharacterised protein [Bacteroides xylanisolvens]
MHDRGIFRQDRDAAFTFQWIRVHDTFCDLLVISENVALLQHGIDQSRLTMVDVSDDGNVADIFSFHFFPFPPRATYCA